MLIRRRENLDERTHPREESRPLASTKGKREARQKFAKKNVITFDARRRDLKRSFEAAVKTLAQARASHERFIYVTLEI